MSFSDDRISVLVWANSFAFTKFPTSASALICWSTLLCISAYITMPLEHCNFFSVSVTITVSIFLFPNSPFLLYFFFVQTSHIPSINRQSIQSNQTLVLLPALSIAIKSIHYSEVGLYASWYVVLLRMLDNQSTLLWPAEKRGGLRAGLTRTREKR